MTTATRAASISALAALVLAAVWLFWPSSLGGGTTYVSTHGISMEPGFQTGDLAILRPADSYAVGDVVAYRSESLDTIVMHRIVAGDANGFVTQGDNNDWLDEDRPTEGEILGTLFLRVPQAGKAIGAVRSPAVLAVLALAGSAVIALLSRSRGRHTRRGSRRGPAGRRSGSGSTQSRRTSGFSMPVRALARQVALGSAVVAVLAAGAAVVLARMPVTQTETATVSVTQEGQFTYGGEAVPGTTYPSGVITTGDTVWTRLAQGLTVSFTNTISGPELADLSGAMRLDVSVTAADGWTATFASSDVVAMADRTATATVAVDTQAAQQLLDAHYAEIGTPGGQATLTVTPVAQTLGTVQGHRFTAGSPAPLAFILDATSLRPAGDLTSDLAPTSGTPVEFQEVVPRTFPLLALTVPLGIARSAAGIVLVLALVGLGAGAWIGRSVRGGVADQFLVKHADRIVPVAAFTPGPAVIDVSDAESLHRVAERFDTVVLHHAGPDEDVFVVRDLDATYRLVVPGIPARQRGKPPVPTRTPVTAPEPAPLAEDLTAPLPMVVTVPTSVSSGLWSGRFA